MSKVIFSERKIFINGKSEQIISGTVHFFRIPRALWRDRLERVRSMGCNCIESYIFWNLSEPRKGVFDFTENNDFEAFFKTVHELGMYAIVRPGPYTCSEQDNGGLPYWLMNTPGLLIRRNNAPYLEAVRDYWSTLIPKIAKLQYDNGGPVIAMQIENEYGGYGHDRIYLETLRDMSREFGITVPLFTADPPGYAKESLTDEVYAVANFGFDSLKNFEEMRKLRPDDPPFCGEFWSSWFDHWGDKAHVERDPQEYASELDDMLSAGGNVNIYAACGGTQFGLKCGANRKPGAAYQPDAASYDFDAPVSECGNITEKYHALKQVIKKFRPDITDETPADPPKRAYGKINFTASALLFENLGNISHPVFSSAPLTFEKLDNPYGFVLYRTKIDGPRTARVSVDPVRDRAHVFLNGNPSGILYRNDAECSTASLTFADGENTLDILVENLGRINYGCELGADPKGISGCLRLGEQMRMEFEQYPLAMDDISGLVFGDFDFLAKTPAFHRAEFVIEDTPCDTFIRFPGAHGCIFINGFNLGRYWNIGPQKTLYLPGCLLKKGKNVITVFETDGLKYPYIELVDRHDFGKTVKFSPEMV